MKFLVVSDLHGSARYAKSITDLFQQGSFDKILFLGDCLYHGPRNPLPEEYNPKQAIELLNPLKEYIIAVRGNCDAEVDQMVLDFSMLADYATIVNEGKRIFATHGHIYSPEKMPKLSAGDIFIYGHVHLPIAKKEDGVYILNPGSITLPKENNPNSYGILDEHGFTIMSLNGQCLKQIAFEE